MKNIFLKSHLIFSLLFLGALFNILLAQNVRNISGIVKDSRGEPVIGATVVIKDLQIGTTTDLDGKFVLEIPHESKQVQISYIGMKTMWLRLSGKIGVCCHSGLAERNAEYHVNFIFYRD